jgi:hypothetical protein
MLLRQHTYACFAIQMRKLLMKVAMRKRMNVAASRHVTGMWLVLWVNSNIQAYRMFVYNVLRRFLISLLEISTHITEQEHETQ